MGEPAREVLRSAHVVFPDEPVGTGARWRAKSVASGADASWLGTWEYTFLGSEDGRLQLEVKSRRNLRRRVAHSSATGQHVELALRTWAQGDVDVDPSAPLARVDLSGGFSYETQLRVGTGIGAAGAKVLMKLDVRAKLHPIP